MKALTLAALALLPVAPAIAQDRFQQEAYLIFDASDVQRVWIGDANKSQVLYYETERGVQSKTLRSIEPQSIWLVEPEAFREAMELYQGRSYQAAAEAFGKVRQTYLKLRELPNNHSSLAAFYEMEALRKLGRYADLLAKMEEFTPDDRESLTREHEVRQLELNALYDAMVKEQWSRLEGLAQDRIDTPLPGYQKVQVGFALGLALEKQDRPLEAVEAYNLAMIGDTGASEVLASKAGLAALRLLQADAEVQEAIAQYGTEAEDPRSDGAERLAEAGALATLYQLNLGGGQALPEEFKPLLKYSPEPKAAAAAAADKKSATQDAEAPKPAAEEEEAAEAAEGEGE